MKLRSRHKSFDGVVEFYEHDSRSTKSPMRFSIFRPDGDAKVPVLFWLSGLTCTEENFTQKSGIQRYLSQYKMACVAMDTSPRGLGFAQETENWTLGAGASYYVNATQEPWAKNYQMYDYVAYELPQLIAKEFNTDQSRQGIFGHSMGGHGALVIGLREPKTFSSISALAPVCAASQSPRGQKAFAAYLGENRELWKTYDASELIRQAKVQRPILVDQGAEDEFFKEGFLMPERLKEAAQQGGYPLELRMHNAYDHSYYFVASFIEDHVKFHSRVLSR